VDLELPYPEPVYEADVVEILANIENMTIPAIVQNYPIPNQIQGYLRYESLVLANPDSHPMAVRAVFDSLALGINKNQVAPRVAVQRLESYKEDLSRLKMELNKGRTIGVTALMILLTLIGAADYFSLYHLFHAYFPLWPVRGLFDLCVMCLHTHTTLTARCHEMHTLIRKQPGHRGIPGEFVRCWEAAESWRLFRE